VSGCCLKSNPSSPSTPLQNSTSVDFSYTIDYNKQKKIKQYANHFRLLKIQHFYCTCLILNSQFLPSTTREHSLETDVFEIFEDIK